ncbi:MAG: hypothetical protein BM563_08465 [Bacteroidetes bacterium MedPE-SWsnd-G1]|nr:MAG: hypothetical protein BM563_08465 [Bacteroidetes bacterium MedPE-SWsnd-G1]
MSNFNHIQEKLQQFIRKYYLNELIKGSILFISFGLIYFMCTLFIEHFLWLQPLARTVLFWLFILVEIGLLTNYIFVPLFKLVGLRKGLSLDEASRLIGTHFKEVDDKLLNVLQLKNESNQSELLLASIEQKSIELVPVPFKKAINFSGNKAYIRYLIVPILIWGVVYVSGNINLFNESYDRVVHHQRAYEPPAPFSFHVLNEGLDVIQGKSITLQIETKGNLIPEDVTIHFLDQKSLTKNNGFGLFEHTFSSVQQNLEFYIESNGVSSKSYLINVIRTPTISSFEMWLDYPSYTKKKDELLKNSGNANVPQGTSITWRLIGTNTSKIQFKTDETKLFNKVSTDEFEFVKRIYNRLDYTISSSNDQLENYESLKYGIEVIKDEYPKIEVKSDIDSVRYGPVQFAGQLSDDYGLNSLELIYYDSQNPSNLLKHPIDIKQLTFEEFYYVFPKGIELREGVDYEMYFQVSDNDKVNGSKNSKSSVFRYYKKTESELEEQLLEEQNESIEDLEKSVQKSKETKDQMQQLQESLQHKSDMNWNDQKKLQNFMDRQQQYENMMQKQTEQIHQNLEEQPKSENKNLEERKEDIQKRLKEAQELAKQDALKEELQKLAEKLDKEELTEKLKQLTEKNRQNERSLERILELTKRFYVEQKANQIGDKLEELSEKQDALSEDDENSSEKQNELNSEFEELQNQLDDLDKENEKLQRPMSLPKTDQEEKGIDKEMSDAKEKLEDSESESKEESEKLDQKKSAKRNQKSAAQKMKQMSEMMQNAMQSMQGESMDEDIEMLRAILENLVEFSFQQEDLMNGFAEINNAHPDFSNKLKKQYVLQEYFEHIDDSLYALSMRQPKIGTQVFKDLGDAHYYLDESLIHFADNQFNVGLSDQQFVMTSTNNIAYLLSNMLNSMQNSSPSMGQGQGDSFSLPDIIQKQGEAIEKMEEGMKKGEKPGDQQGDDGKPQPGESGEKSGEGSGEQMNGELYEIYKQQSELRQLLEDALGDKKGADSKGVGENALKQMEQIEQDLLEKGFTNEVLQKMMQLKYELLKLEEAAYKQGQDTKRESNTNTGTFENRIIKQLKRDKLWFQENEILIRQTLPLQEGYKKRVQQYFKANDSIQ